MPDAKARATPDPTRNLAVVVAGLILGAFLWSWFSFSGPFRRLIDLELRLFGGYSEASVAVLLGVAFVFAVLTLAGWRRPGSCGMRPRTCPAWTTRCVSWSWTS